MAALIANLKIGPCRVEGWSGVEAVFEWTETGKVRFQALVSERQRPIRQLRCEKTRAQERIDDLELGLLYEITSEVEHSPELAAYVAALPSVAGEGGFHRVPRFGFDDCSDWGFHNTGGSISTAEPGLT